MHIEWIDVSIPLDGKTTVWPGDPPFELTPLARIQEGAECNVSVLALGAHCGTHVDAPWHFEDDGKRLHEVGAQVFFGRAGLIDVGDVKQVRADDLGPAPLPERLLIKSRNSDFNMHGPFRQDYTALEADAAQRLVDEEVRLVGIDYLSIAPYEQPGQPTHHILLQIEVFIVEGLRLAGTAAGTYWFTVLPLHLRHADGAPCRAFLGRDVSDA